MRRILMLLACAHFFIFTGAFAQTRSSPDELAAQLDGLSLQQWQGFRLPSGNNQISRGHLATLVARGHGRAMVVEARYLSRSQNQADVQRAAALFKAACDQGEPWGCNIAGQNSLDGTNGQARDPAMALAYFRRSCENSYPWGCVNQARVRMLDPASPPGVVAESRQALTTRCSSPESAANREACKWLGVAARDGQGGVARSVNQAVAYFRAGCNPGVSTAEAACRELSAILAPLCRDPSTNPTVPSARVLTLASDCTALGQLLFYSPAASEQPGGIAFTEAYASACTLGDAEGCKAIGGFVGAQVLLLDGTTSQADADEICTGYGQAVCNAAFRGLADQCRSPASGVTLSADALGQLDIYCRALARFHELGLNPQRQRSQTEARSALTVGCNTGAGGACGQLIALERQSGQPRSAPRMRELDVQACGAAYSPNFPACLRVAALSCTSGTAAACMSIVDLDQRDGEDVVLQGRRFRINLDSDYQRDAWVEVLGGVLEALDERCAQRTDINACMPVFVYLPYFVAEDWSRNTSTQLAGTRLNTPSASLTAVMRAGDAVCGTQQFESCTEHALRLVAQASSHNYPASDRNLRRGREYLWQLCFNTAYQGRASACSSGARAYSDRGNPSTENAHRLIALYDEGCKAGRVDACQEAFYIYRDGRYGLSRNRQAAIEMVRFVWRYRGTWPGAEGWARAAFSDMGVSVPAD